MLSRDEVEALFDPYKQRLADALWKVDRDLGEYRSTQPRLATRTTPRLLGAQVHAWAWHYLMAEFDGCEDVSFADLRPDGGSDETKRELVWFDGRIWMRVKRHRSGTLRISYNRTAHAQRFFDGNASTRRQPVELSLFHDERWPGATSTTLAWIADELTGRFVELRVVAWNAKKPAWSFQLPDASWTASTERTVPPVDGPPVPDVRTAEEAESDHREEDSGE